MAPGGRAATSAPRPHAIVAELEPVDLPLGLGDLVRRHLREVARLQHLAAGDGEPRLDLDFLALRLARGRCRSSAHRLGDARRRGGALARFRRADRLEEARQHLLEELAAPPEQPERLVEDRLLVVPLHEDGVERPVEILARVDAGDLDRADRVDHRRRTDRQPGAPEHAGEMDDVVGEPPAFRRLGRRVVHGTVPQTTNWVTAKKIAAVLRRRLDGAEPLGGLARGHHVGGKRILRAALQEVEPLAAAPAVVGIDDRLDLDIGEAGIAEERHQAPAHPAVDVAVIAEMEDAPGQLARPGKDDRRLPVHLDAHHAAAAPHHAAHLGNDVLRLVDMEEHPMAEGAVEDAVGEGQRPRIADLALDDVEHVGLGGGAAGDVEEELGRIERDDLARRHARRRCRW